MSRFGRTRSIALAVALAVAAPSVAVAQPQAPTAAARAEAAARFKKGYDLFKDGDYQAALIEFRRAYDLAPNYQVLYNIGQVSIQLQDYPGALAALQKYLVDGGQRIPAARRADVERDIDKLQSRVANLDIVVNVPDADVIVDDVNVGKTPLPKSVLVSVGKHRVVVSKPGYTSASRVLGIASQETQKLTFELQETSRPQPAVTPTPPPTEPKSGEATPQPAPQPATPPAEEKPANYTPAIVSWSVTGGLTAGAVIFGVVALGASSDLKTLRGTVTTRDALDSAASKTSTFALLTDIFGGAAIAGAGVSIYLTATAKPSDEAPAAAPAATGGIQRVRLGLTPGGASISGVF